MLKDQGADSIDPDLLARLRRDYGVRPGTDLAMPRSLVGMNPTQVTASHGLVSSLAGKLVTAWLMRRRRKRCQEEKVSGTFS